MTKGFTLAEVLITLGVIGIVAALTIPNVITNYKKKQTVTQLKATYSIINQAIKMSEAENGDISGWNRNMSRFEFYNTYLVPYLKIIDTRYYGQIKPNISHKRLNGTIDTGFSMFKSNSKIATLSNGSILFLDYDGQLSENTKYLGIGVDINGTTSPNVVGKDFFVFSLNFDNKNCPILIPYGACNSSDSPFGEMTRENIITPKGLNYACNKNASGHFCAALIMLDGWKIADDYPW
jgi:prepilin-type N-terminal cleavage/methylation domain-containing protein